MWTLPLKVTMTFIIRHDDTLMDVLLKTEAFVQRKRRANLAYV